jgi:hypothetical protein
MTDTNRRETISMLAAGAAVLGASGTAAAQGAAEPAGLRAAFLRLLDPATRESMLAQVAIVIDNPKTPASASAQATPRPCSRGAGQGGRRSACTSAP